MFEKKFSVGLNLNEEEKVIIDFIDKYHAMLNSIYFSLPLGIRFYSRFQLIKEYEDQEDKLLRIINLMKKYKIRREVTLNTYGLTKYDLIQAFEYMDRTCIPEEIVCLNDYGDMIKERYPSIELKYSFNNDIYDGKISKNFDTIVVGKEFLRNRDMRHVLIDYGYGVTLLLNNGCAFSCHQKCSSENCKNIMEGLMKRYSVDELYAQQSFFPSELNNLLLDDTYGEFYKFKISNRPLGIKYTSKVLDYYLSLKDPGQESFLEWKNYGFFCTCGQMARHFEEINFKNIMSYKEKYARGLLNDCCRK